MRVYTAHHVRYRAGRVQGFAFGAAIGLALVFIALALYGLERPAIAVSILGAIAIGISVGAWCVGYRFED